MNGKPRSLSGEETFGQPEAGPSWDLKGPWAFNGPVSRYHRYEGQKTKQLKLF
ncbi:MAG: hypothetical protein R3B95_12460 [Nitrospirales bacterium]|nr:hypothetical protein [Nitrospirales bacterium]